MPVLQTQVVKIGLNMKSNKSTIAPVLYVSRPSLTSTDHTHPHRHPHTHTYTPTPPTAAACFSATLPPLAKIPPAPGVLRLWCRTEQGSSLECSYSHSLTHRPTGVHTPP